MEFRSSETLGVQPPVWEKRTRLIRPKGGAASVIAETSVGVFGLHRAGHTRRPDLPILDGRSCTVPISNKSSVPVIIMNREICIHQNGRYIHRCTFLLTKHSYVTYTQSNLALRPILNITTPLHSPFYSYNYQNFVQLLSSPESIQPPYVNITLNQLIIYRYQSI